MEVPDPKQKPLGVVENKGGVAVVTPPGDLGVQQIGTTPAQIHQETAQKIAASLTQADLLPIDGQVATQPPDEKTIKQTPEITQVGGEVVGDSIEMAGNVFRDKFVYPLLGSSHDVSKFSMGEGGKADSIWDVKKKKEEQVAPDKSGEEVGE